MNHLSPTLASQATAELPKLPELPPRWQGSTTTTGGIPIRLFTADQMNAHYLAGVEAGRASRAQSEPLTDEQIEQEWFGSDMQPQLYRESPADLFAAGARFAERAHGIRGATLGETK